jgi:hypothetical protein
MSFRLRRSFPQTGLSYAEQSPWARPKPQLSGGTPGIEVAELPREEIEIPVMPAPAPTVQNVTDVDGETPSDPRLLRIAVAIVVLVAALAVLWAMLV